MPTLSKPRARVNWNAAPAYVKKGKQKSNKVVNGFDKNRDVAFATTIEECMSRATKGVKPLF